MDLVQLSEVLRCTLAQDNQKRKEAEKFLDSADHVANYGLLLLQLLTANEADDVVRVAAAVTFKNFVKKNWRIIEGEPQRISENDRNLVKTNIVELMLKSPDSIQRQLSEAISIIGKEDFPDKWKDLLGNLTSHMKVSNEMDLKVVDGVLQTAHSLFKRFRYEFKSNELWAELKIVLDNFASPLLDLFEGMIEKVKTTTNNLHVQKQIFEVLIMISKIFYSLNYQDLPEFFEDNLKRWMEPFLMLIVTDFPHLVDKDADEAGPLELLRSQICDNVGMYAQKYDEEFQEFLPIFVEAIWNLLTSTDNNVKNDLLVSNAIKFLASVCERPHYKSIFDKEATLQSICQNVIVPNMMFRDADEELFEDNPEEYIRKDIEGSDVDTRRRSACDLVRGLCKFFEAVVTNIFSQYVNQLLQQYSTNPAANWKAKDAVIFIVTSLAAKKSTAKHGTTETNQLVNLVDFFKTQIEPDLRSPNIDEHPVLKADAIKYVITFRSVLPREVLQPTFQYLVKLLKSQSNVVHTYAANAIEKLLLVRLPSGANSFTAQDILPINKELFLNLFGALQLPGSEENEYVMKAIMRVCTTLQDSLSPFVKDIIESLTQKLTIVSKNPSKPQFNHYLFESICTLVRGVGKTDKAAVAVIEESVFPVVQIILVNDVTEFLPYVFQVLSLTLETREHGVQGPYMDLFPLLLQPVLWERQGNVPALTRLLQAYVKRGPNDIITNSQLNPLLGVFQKLLASRATDHEAFYLLSTMSEYMPWEAICESMKQVFVLLFQRLQTSKTTKYVKGFIVFVSLFAGKKSAEDLQKLIDNVQPKLFAMMIEKILVADLQKVSGTIERKICAVGVTKMLTECPAFFQEEYIQQWPKLLEALVGLFELPEDDSVAADDHFIDVEDTPGYQTAFSQLAFAGKRDADPFSTVVCPKEFLAKQLYRVSTAHPGKVKSLCEGINHQALNFLQGYLTKAQVQLV